jgi:hypothetical protein
VRPEVESTSDGADTRAAVRFTQRMERPMSLWLRSGTYRSGCEMA